MRTLFSVFTFLLILAGLVVFFMYLFLSKQPESIVSNYLKSSEKVMVNYDEYGNVVFVPQYIDKIGIIFYPENLVLAESYAPLCFRLAEEGYKVVIIKPFLNMAFFSHFKAKKVIEEETIIKNWIIIGHGIGGSVGSYTVKAFPQKISGIVFLASYPYFNISEYDVKSLEIYGEFDGIVSYEQIKRNLKKFPKGTEFFEIKGGNHSYFGYFGVIFGDGETLLNKEQQQEIVFQKIKEFLNNIKHNLE